MVKAKEFWKILSDLGYNFFSGVAYSEFVSLYKAMDSKIMHYVPAADETIALGLVSGAYMAGYKGGIIIDTKFMSDISRALKFNREFKIPMLIIGMEDYNFSLPKKKINKQKDMEVFISEIERRSVPGLMILGEGVLK